MLGIKHVLSRDCNQKHLLRHHMKSWSYAYEISSAVLSLLSFSLHFPLPFPNIQSFRRLGYNLLSSCIMGQVLGGRFLPIIPFHLHLPVIFSAFYASAKCPFTKLLFHPHFLSHLAPLKAYNWWFIIHVVDSR